MRERREKNQVRSFSTINILLLFWLPSRHQFYRSFPRNSIGCLRYVPVNPIENKQTSQARTSGISFCEWAHNFMEELRECWKKSSRVAHLVKTMSSFRENFELILSYYRRSENWEISFLLASFSQSPKRMLRLSHLASDRSTTLYPVDLYQPRSTISQFYNSRTLTRVQWTNLIDLRERPRSKSVHHPFSYENTEMVVPFPIRFSLG